MQNTEPSRISLVDISDNPPLPRDGKFHVRLVEGLFQNIRRITSWPTLVLFFATVWIEIDQKPAVFFDFDQHRILLFGADISWYDLPTLAGLLIAAASLLFLLAVAWGRVWCGFACPQSIWTWVFIRIENWTEGSAAKRNKLSQQHLSGIALIRRIAKHLCWIAFSVFTAITFTGYFVPIREIFDGLLSLNLSLTLVGWVIIMAALTYINAGLVREKVCLHMCPYSRFQGVMFDRDTYTVAYDMQRGEPRAHARQQTNQSGDCVDCHLCVQVCPAGIDIRDGLQSACIDCGACIDACDFVMEKLNKPKGLIGFYSDKQLSAQGEKTALFRFRFLGYLSIFVIAMSAVLFSLQNRTLMTIEIMRERGALFQVINGQICNNYLVELEKFTDNFSALAVEISSSQPTTKLIPKGPKEVKFLSNSAIASYQICLKNSDKNPESNSKNNKSKIPERSEIIFKFTNKTFSLAKSTTFIASANHLRNQ